MTDPNTDLERRLKLEKAYKSGISDDEFAKFCEANDIQTADWKVKWDGSKWYSEYWADDIYGSMHLLHDAAQKGEAGLLRIPEKYRKALTGADFDDYLVYADSEEGGGQDSPWALISRRRVTREFMEKYFPQVYLEKFRSRGTNVKPLSGPLP